MPRFARLLILLVLTALIGLSAGCSWVDAKEREFIFRPVKADWRGYGGEMDKSRITIPVGNDGGNLSAWWMPGQTVDAPAMLFLHGARWNLTGSSGRIARYR